MRVELDAPPNERLTITVEGTAEELEIARLAALECGLRLVDEEHHAPDLRP